MPADTFLQTYSTARTWILNKRLKNREGCVQNQPQLSDRQMHNALAVSPGFSNCPTAYPAAWQNRAESQRQGKQPPPPAKMPAQFRGPIVLKGKTEQQQQKPRFRRAISGLDQLPGLAYAVDS